MRLALKLATGAGKTTVMAMLIAWQTINAVRRPGSKNFTRGFLVVAPGPDHQGSFARSPAQRPRQLLRAAANWCPATCWTTSRRAKIVITNYHAFKLRERIELSAGGRSLLQGRTGDELNTLETEGQMIQRVMPDLMGMKNILVLNDEAHHCYREKPARADDEDLKGDERKEAEKNNEAARLWISGLEAVNRKLGVARVIDLSATPFFLSGSGYAEGTLVPLDDERLLAHGRHRVRHRQTAARSRRRKHSRRRNADVTATSGRTSARTCPRRAAARARSSIRSSFPPAFRRRSRPSTATTRRPSSSGRKRASRVPPCFIIVCQNTAISKLVYDFVSGFHRKNEDGTTTLENGRLALFRNFDETTGNPLPRPNTLLIDSEQLEAGDALDDNFRAMAADEIERFRREIIERTGDARAGENLTDQELLREVMNTVGKPGQLGGSIRCVVSVSMLTEGWDANTVTHVLGIRAFGTQLLCEQVIGRALRRQSYDLNDGRALQCRIRRCLRHSLRLHGQARHRPAAAAA